MADIHPNLGGSVHIIDSSYGQIVRWGKRSLYLLLFLSGLVTFNMFEYPITLPFIGSVFCLVFAGLSYIQDKDRQTIKNLREIPESIANEFGNKT